MKRIILRNFLFSLAAVASLITMNHAAIADDQQALSPGELMVNESIFPPGTVPLDIENTELTLAFGAPVVNPVQAYFTLACNQLPPPGLSLEIRPDSNIRFAKTGK
jgi:hypothetical protein